MWKKILLGAAILPVMTGGALAQTALRANQIVDVQGVRTACGGASLEDQQAMSGQGYPVILKQAGASGQWLGEEKLTISGKGQDITFECQGPWVALQLPPGHYRATAELQGASPRAVNFIVGSGTREVMIRFPEITEGRRQPAEPGTSSMEVSFRRVACDLVASGSRRNNVCARARCYKAGRGTACTSTRYCCRDCSLPG